MYRLPQDYLSANNLEANDKSLPSLLHVEGKHNTLHKDAFRGGEIKLRGAMPLMSELFRGNFCFPSMCAC